MSLVVLFFFSCSICSSLVITFSFSLFYFSVRLCPLFPFCNWSLFGCVFCASLLCVHVVEFYFWACGNCPQLKSLEKERLQFNLVSKGVFLASEFCSCFRTWRLEGNLFWFHPCAAGLCLFLTVRGHVMTSKIMNTGPLATLLTIISDQASHFFVHQSIQWRFSSKILNLMLKVSFTICWFQRVSCPIVSRAQLSIMTFHPIFMANNWGELWVSLLTFMMGDGAVTFIAASHQKETMMLWPQFWRALLLSIFMYTVSLKCTASELHIPLLTLLSSRSHPK